MAELTILRDGRTVKFQFQPEKPLADALREAGVPLSHPCGGRGVCGKCAVKLKGRVSPPDEAERRAGARLACRAVLLGDAEVTLPDARKAEQIEMGTSDALTPRQPMPGDYGAAADIGTTTLALRLFELRTGACVGEAGALNPQTSLAADVIGRIGAAMNGQGPLLRQQASDGLEALLAEACAQAGVAPDAVKSWVVTGNTAMLYLFAGRDPASLSRAPFQADWLFDEETDWKGRRVYLPPCMHAFVGADITCAVLASGQSESRALSLLCDVGTNGELALWRDGRLLVTSTAAGPAFEGAGISCGCGSVRGAIDAVTLMNGQVFAHTIGGAPPVGLCGSGLIDAVAAGLALEVIDETGAMGQADFPLSGNVRLLPKDIRAVQLAKGAVAAGLETLMEEAGVSCNAIETLYIAGGFGKHLNLSSAAAIGLFPAALTPRARVIGNAALDGAAMLLLDQGRIEKARAVARLSRHVDLGGNPRFNQHYMDSMFFPTV